MPHFDLVVARLFVYAEEVVVVELPGGCRCIAAACITASLGLRITHADIHRLRATYLGESAAMRAMILTPCEQLKNIQ